MLELSPNPVRLATRPPALRGMCASGVVSRARGKIATPVHGLTGRKSLERKRDLFPAAESDSASPYFADRSFFGTLLATPLPRLSPLPSRARSFMPTDASYI